MSPEIVVVMVVIKLEDVVMIDEVVVCRWTVFVTSAVCHGVTVFVSVVDVSYRRQVFEVSES